MSNPSALDICRTDLFTKADELRQRFPPTVVEKVLRIREMYNWFISNPDASDREFAAEIMQRHGERTEKVQTCHKGGPNVPSSISPQRNVALARSVGAVFLCGGSGRH